MNKSELEPHQVVLDTVLKYSAFMPKLGQCAVLQGNFIFATKNHRGDYVSMAVPVHFDGEPADGENPRFVLWQIAPTVWKLSPSVLHPLYHGYITIVDVPEAGW